MTKRSAPFAASEALAKVPQVTLVLWLIESPPSTLLNDHIQGAKFPFPISGKSPARLDSIDYRRNLKKRLRM